MRRSGQPRPGPRRPTKWARTHRYLSRLTMRPSMSLAENSHGASTAPVVGGRALQGKDRLSGRLTRGACPQPLGPLAQPRVPKGRKTQALGLSKMSSSSKALLYNREQWAGVIET